MSSDTSGKMHGWQGVILRVDLNSHRTITSPTSEYAHEYMGGRGIATRIAWDILPSEADPYHEDAPLIFMTGPLTGTTAPFSGRTTVCGLAPQGYPVPWFTRSSFGGHWGPCLKHAGFDGIVVTGISEKPVYLLIDDGRVEIRPAMEHWG